MAIEYPGSQHQSPPGAQHRYDVNIEAYVRLSFDEEVELTGYIGDAAFTAESGSAFRSFSVKGEVGGMSSELHVSRRKFRAQPVKGHVMGQLVEGTITTKAGDVIFDGMAGLEPIHYLLDSRGACSNRSRDLGVKVVYQSFYSEIIGSVARIPDAAMVGLLLPVRLFNQEAVYG